ncbi:FAD-binding oxidoreductase [Ramlibacter sp. WS9]|uniref:NAD(P)/FAD-dependent oxidoreductase n=1 Tax=Ramlibacter sp. WS9 TaxID=1882741 RepID=UPI001142890E|nr:FAD-dependent oxidoreductase [Ramlibacter sp. WS9]ROZ72372.1 FAD-binding oxidoreductase [Ramlibacter sp. WS9]
MREFDVAIIGAGIAGASLGYRLAPRCAVAVLERETQPGYHATGRSAAMFMESYGPPMVRALTRASRAFYQAPPAGFAEHALLAPRGALYVATHEQAHLLGETQAELEATGSRVERLDAAATLAKAPCLRPETVHGALFESDAQDIDVGALHQGFLRGLRASGGVVRTGAEVVGATRDGDAWKIELTGGELLRARVVVDAAGAWADAVARVFGAAPLGLEPRRRSAFTFKPPEGVDVSAWPAVAGIDESYYFKPDAGQLLGSPANADPTVAHDVVPEELDIAMGIHQIETATTLSIRRPSATWAGLRTFAPDGEIVIGWDDGCEGFFWLAGQGGYGIQSAAGASELAAALVLHEPLPAALHAQGVDARLVSPNRLR